VVIVPKFDFVRFLESIVLYRVTHLMWEKKAFVRLSGNADACFRVVPPMAVLLAKHSATKNYDLSHVRFLVIGAAPVSAELQEQVVKVIPNAEVGQAYGMTETCTVVSLFPLSQRTGTPGSAGMFIPGLRARIVKPDGTAAKAGEQGELYVTGPSMALGYHNNEKACVEFHYMRAQ
jgi:acyl-CoA synthetase (AMP-forming)/AMP-acid ligase II